MTPRQAAEALYQQLHTPNHYLSPIDIPLIDAALQAQRAEEVAAIQSKCAESPDYDEFIDWLDARAKEYQK